MTALAGYLLGAKGDIHSSVLLGMLIGTSPIIACGCVLNNIMDRRIDKKMKRTANRALVTGEINVKSAGVYAALLGMSGIAILVTYTNVLVLLAGMVGLFSYVVLYGYFKRHSIHGTLVGSIAGATPLVAGYCAASGHFDPLARTLFVIMAIWQMPHFYAIGVYKREEYAKAGLPIWPVARGVASTKKYILGYILLYIAAIIWMFVAGYAGRAYMVVMLIVGGWWLSYAIKGFRSKDDLKYGHQIFGSSLVVLLVFSLLISVDHFLP